MPELHIYRDISDKETEYDPPRVSRDFDAVPTGISRCALVQRAHGNQQPADRGEVFTPFGDVSIPGRSLFSSLIPESQPTSDQSMGLGFLHREGWCRFEE